MFQGVEVIRGEIFFLKLNKRQINVFISLCLPFKLDPPYVKMGVGRPTQGGVLLVGV